MFLSRRAIVGQSADPFTMLVSCCYAVFGSINESRLVSSFAT